MWRENIDFLSEKIFKTNDSKLLRKIDTFVSKKLFLKVITSKSRLDAWLDDPDKRILLFLGFADLNYRYSIEKEILGTRKVIFSSKLCLPQVRRKIIDLMKEDKIFRKIVSFSFVADRKTKRIQHSDIVKAIKFIKTLSVSIYEEELTVDKLNLPLVFLFIGNQIVKSPNISDDLINLIFTNPNIIKSTYFSIVLNEVIIPNFHDKIIAKFVDAENFERIFKKRLDKSDLLIIIKESIEHSKNEQLINQVINKIANESGMELRDIIYYLEKLGKKPIFLFIRNEIDTLDKRIKEAKEKGEDINVPSVIYSLISSLREKFWNELPKEIQEKLLSKFIEGVREDFKDILPDEILEQINPSIKVVESVYKDRDNICYPVVKIDPKLFNSINKDALETHIEDKDFDTSDIDRIILRVFSYEYLESSTVFQTFVYAFVNGLSYEIAPDSYEIYELEDMIGEFKLKEVIGSTLVAKAISDSKETREFINDIIERYLSHDSGLIEYILSLRDEFFSEGEDFDSIFKDISTEIWTIYRDIKKEDKNLFSKIDIEKSQNITKVLLIDNDDKIVIPLLRDFLEQIETLKRGWESNSQEAKEKIEFFEKNVANILKGLSNKDFYLHFSDLVDDMILNSIDIESNFEDEDYEGNMGILNLGTFEHLIINSYHNIRYGADAWNVLFRELDYRSSSEEKFFTHIQGIRWGNYNSLNDTFNFMKKHGIGFDENSFSGKLFRILKSDDPLEEFGFPRNRKDTSFLNKWLKDIVRTTYFPVDLPTSNPFMEIKERMDSLLNSLEFKDTLINEKLDIIKSYHSFLERAISPKILTLSPLNQENLTFQVSINPRYCANFLLVVFTDMYEEIYGLPIDFIFGINDYIEHQMEKGVGTIRGMLAGKYGEKLTLSYFYRWFAYEIYNFNRLTKIKLKNVQESLQERAYSIIKDTLIGSETKINQEELFNIYFEYLIGEFYRLYVNIKEALESDKWEKEWANIDKNVVLDIFETLFPKTKLKSLAEPIRPIVQKYFYRDGSNRFINQSFFNLSSLRKSIKNKIKEILGHIKKTTITVSFHPLDILNMNFSGDLQSCQSIYSEMKNPRLPIIVKAVEMDTGIAFTFNPDKELHEGRFTFCFSDEEFSLGSAEIINNGSSQSINSLSLFMLLNCLASVIYYNIDFSSIKNGRYKCSLY